MMYVTVQADSSTARAAIRHVHRSLCTRLAAAQAEDDAGFARDYSSVVAAVEAAFRHEEALLARMGHVDLRAAIEDNATLLCALHRVLPRVEAGDVGLGRQVVGALRDVLALRRIACDAALAALFVRARIGPRTAPRVGQRSGPPIGSRYGAAHRGHLQH